MAAPHGLMCQELIELVTEYAEGTLEAAERSRFEAHLDVCQGCRTYVDQMRRTIQLVGRLNERDIPAAVKQRLLSTFHHWRRRS